MYDIVFQLGWWGQHGEWIKIYLVLSGCQTGQVLRAGESQEGDWGDSGYDEKHVAALDPGTLQWRESAAGAEQQPAQLCGQLCRVRLQALHRELTSCQRWCQWFMW